MYLLYSLTYIAALIFLLPFQYLKRPEELRRRWLREKFGFFDSLLTTPHSSLIWVHAVSMGEVMAALPLLKRLRERYPSKGIILSTITDTGQKVAKERAPEGTVVLYLPFDITSILNLVLKRMKPKILIVIETELWPNIFRVFKKNMIPIIVLNGRISENSFKGYKKLSFFMKRVLSCVDFFGMQGEVYAERIRGLGVDERKIKVLGNFKFDTQPPSQIPEWMEKIKGPVIVAGSTHEGEEEIMISVYSRLKEDFPHLNLIIAPRHPERFKEVEDLLRLKRVQFIKRSEFKTSNPPTPPLVKGGEIILLDSVGELSAIYGISDIAIIGKSFKGYGGQNPLEPAYWGKLILCGPHMENFPIIKDFYKEGAALEVNEEGLFSRLRELLLSPEKAKEMGSKAKELYMKNAGVVERAAEIIAGYISE